MAAILVLFFHTGGNLAKDKYFGEAAEPLARLFIFGGSAGVAFFFVLSGFIIVLVHGGDVGHPERAGRYVRRRLTRIYPTYLLVFAAVYLGALAAPSLRDAMPKDAVVLLSSLLLLPQDAAVVGGTGAPVIVVAWSLQYEMVFYALVGLAVLHPVLGGAALAALALNFAVSGLGLGGAQHFPASFFANPLMLLFAMGAAVAALERSGWRMPRPVPVAIAATLAFFVLCGVAEWRNDGHSLGFSIGYGLSGAIAIAALTQAERQRPARFGSRAASLLGDASYALYLIHFPLIAVLCKLAVLGGLRGASGALVSFVLISLLCVGAAVVFYRWVERPILDALSPARKRGIQPAA
ncbi:MAG: acyltransferase [Variovorax sp.]|nr:acyltransferase [Variovorax sp.]